MAKVRPAPVSQPQSKPVSGPPRSRVMRTVGKGYSDAGASYVKKALKGFLANSGSPAEDIDYNNYTLRQRSRMLYMAAPIATAALKRQRTNVVGNGLRLKCAINRERLGMTPEAAEEWQKHTEAEFACGQSGRTPATQPASTTSTECSSLSCCPGPCPAMYSP